MKNSQGVGMMGAGGGISSQRSTPGTFVKIIRARRLWSQLTPLSAFNASSITVRENLFKSAISPDPITPDTLCVRLTAGNPYEFTNRGFRRPSGSL